MENSFWNNLVEILLVRSIILCHLIFWCGKIYTARYLVFRYRVSRYLVFRYLFPTKRSNDSVASMCLLPAVNFLCKFHVNITSVKVYGNERMAGARERPRGVIRLFVFHLRGTGFVPRGMSFVAFAIDSAKAKDDFGDKECRSCSTFCTHVVVDTS